MRKIALSAITIIFCTALGSCAFMKNLEGAYGDKGTQQKLKEMGALVDTLKYQDEEHYTFRILAANADRMVDLGETMAGCTAPDSYYNLNVNRLIRHSGELKAAAVRSDPASTRKAIEGILQEWGILDQYIYKP